MSCRFFGCLGKTKQGFFSRLVNMVSDGCDKLTIGVVKKMLVFAGLSPHPPLIVPEVGGEDLNQVKSTVRAMQEWALAVHEAQPDSLVFISPHGCFLRDQIPYLGEQGIAGDFAVFGAPEVSFQVTCNLSLAEEIAAEAARDGVDVVPVGRDYWYHNVPGTLDHGITVPLYYLQKAGVDLPLTAFGISLLPLPKLYAFGQALGRVVDRVSDRIALIASGDLSHRLLPGAPAGYNPKGREFDLIIKDSLEKMDVDRILNLPADLIEAAGECGLRPIVMLFGALHGHQVEPKIYSYEGPFGVGYLVAGFKVKEGSSEHKRSPYVELARQSLEYYLKHGELMPVPDPVPEGMDGRAGVFVSLKKNGQLRGCIGTFEPCQENIASEIIHNAVAAGVNDPRFWPVELDEIPELDFSVDVLTPPEPVRSRDELDPKRYGVIVNNGRRTGLLLPDLDGVDTVDEQLSIACQKAGIAPDEPIHIFRFEVNRYD